MSLLSCWCRRWCSFQLLLFLLSKELFSWQNVEIRIWLFKFLVLSILSNCWFISKSTRWQRDLNLTGCYCKAVVVNTVTEQGCTRWESDLLVAGWCTKWESNLHLPVWCTRWQRDLNLTSCYCKAVVVNTVTEQGVADGKVICLWQVDAPNGKVTCIYQTDAADGKATCIWQAIVMNRLLEIRRST